MFGFDGLFDGFYYFYGRKISYIDFFNKGKFDFRYFLIFFVWVYFEGFGLIFYFFLGGVCFWVVRLNILFV